MLETKAGLAVSDGVLIVAAVVGRMIPGAVMAGIAVGMEVAVVAGIECQITSAGGSGLMGKGLLPLAVGVVHR